ncbi:MAG: YdcH family protein [Deltaproteobacteria bacterium]
MEQQDQEVIQSLLDHDFELRRHYAEHVDLERQIKAFNGQPSLSSSEEMTRKSLQKKKLAGKDRMMAIVSRLRSVEAIAAPG